MFDLSQRVNSFLSNFIYLAKHYYIPTERMCWTINDESFISICVHLICILIHRIIRDPIDLNNWTHISSLVAYCLLHPALYQVYFPSFPQMVNLFVISHCGYRINWSYHFQLSDWRFVPSVYRGWRPGWEKTDCDSTLPGLNM